jgi:hypothetical protein
MMRRNVETTLITRVCQLVSLLVILCMVLGMLAQEITHGADTARIEPVSTRLVAAP